jgi:predicted ester cyclase
MNTLTEHNKVIALRFAEAGWGTQPHWQEVWDDVMAPNVIYHFNSTPDAIVGLDANKAFNASLFEGFPDISQTIEDVIAEGDNVVYRTTMEGTHTGDFLGIPPTGKSARVNDFTMLRILNDRIVEWWYECNLLEVMKQLGLMPDAA